jgi:hypothetical protein
MALSDSTLLVITGLNIPTYAARGLTQTLDLITEGSHLERSVNGTMVDFSNPSFRKYKSKITCTDQETPAIDGIYRGALVTVQCVQELAYPVGGAATRTVVAGSLRLSSDGTQYFYQPSLEMIVMDFHVSSDEYKAEVAWSLDLEEQ